MKLDIYKIRTFVYRNAEGAPVFFCQTETEAQANEMYTQFTGYLPSEEFPPESHIMADGKNWGSNLIPKAQWIDCSRQYTCNGKHVIDLRIELTNSTGAEVTYPVKGTVVLNEKPRKVKHMLWTLDGRADTVWGNQTEDLKLVRLCELPDSEISQMHYCIQCTDQISGEVGCFLHKGDFKAISPVFRNLVSFYAWRRREGLKGADSLSFEIAKAA